MLFRSLADPEGSNEASLVALLATLRLDAAGAVRAELALTLARKLDEGAGLAVAAVGREYRACVESLLMWTQAKEPTKLEELQARAAERRRMSGEERQRRADDLG